HYRRVVIQQKMRENVSKSDAEHIFYEDALMNGKTGQIDGLGRAPKGVNDGNGFVFISHIGDVYPSGLLPIKAGNVRQTPLATIYRESEVFKNLRNPYLYKENAVFVSFVMFVEGHGQERITSRGITWKVNRTVYISREHCGKRNEPLCE